LHTKPADVRCPDESHSRRWSLLQGPTPGFVQLLPGREHTPPRTQGAAALPLSWVVVVVPASVLEAGLGSELEPVLELVPEPVPASPGDGVPHSLAMAAASAAHSGTTVEY
jgi:hypothetical protein